MWANLRRGITRPLQPRAKPRLYALASAVAGDAKGQDDGVSAAMFEDFVRRCGLSKKRLHRELFPADGGYSAPLGEFPFAVAVSGGADSMALMLLLREYLQINRIKTPLLAVTVDHKLRPESSEEAVEVARVCAKHGGIEHITKVCDWFTGEVEQRGNGNVSRRVKPGDSKMEEHAREFRYELLREVCRDYGVRCLFVAHNLGDQIETTLFRLGRASGINGLAGISGQLPFAISRASAGEEDKAVMLLRPLLSVPKDQLMVTCRRFQQTWVHDPCNDDPVYDRVRIRQELKRLEKERGPDILNLFSRFQQIAAKAKKEFARVEQKMIRKHVAVWESDAVVLRMSAFKDPEMFDELLHRVLSKIIMHVGNKETPPRLASVIRLAADVQRLDTGKQVTLGGCRIKRIAKGYKLQFLPERKALW